MIVSDMYRLVVDMGDERIVAEKFVYCESCYLEIIK